MVSPRLKDNEVKINNPILVTLMDTTSATLTHLFEQLGLDSSPSGINKFLSQHIITGSTKLTEASFWNHAQKAFLEECLKDDAQWSELVDQLDVLLRS